MKKLLTICLLVAMTITVKAQTETETIQWINSKKIEMSSDSGHQQDAEIFDLFKISSHAKPDTEYYRLIKWENIIDISFDNKSKYIIIKGKVGSVDVNSISMNCVYADEVMINKMIKVLKHMATLKGATFVKDDLFGN